MSDERTCKRCGKVYPLVDFYLTSKAGSRRHTCKYCFRVSTLKTRDENREKFQAYWRKASSGYYHKNPRNVKLRKLYGISEDQFLEMYGAQKGRCKICGSTTDLCVDHCHEGKRVRGLLCRNCNLGLGNFKDNPDLLLGAVEYLKYAG